MPRPQKPLTYEWNVEGSRIAGCCIPPGPEGSFSLRDLYSQKDHERDPSLGNRIAQEMRERGLQVAFAPSVAAMSGEIVSQDDLTSRIELASDVTLYRNKNIPADGVRLHRGHATIMSSAGCPIVVTHGSGYTFAAHMGRKSALDEDRIRGNPQRRHEGVLYALAHEYLRLNVPLSEVQVLMLFAIKPEDFQHPLDHPEYGEFNRAMREYIVRRWGYGIMTEGSGQFSMPALGKAQAQKIGFRSFMSKCALPALKSFASTRDPRAQFAQSRNLAMVWRC